MRTENNEKKTKEDNNELIVRQQGWECPRCLKINSPATEQCKCEKDISLTDVEEILETFKKGELETTPYFSDGVELPL